MLSTQLIIMNYPVPPPTQHHSFFRNLTLLIPKYLHVVHIDRISLIRYFNFRCSFVFPCCFVDIYSLVIPNPLLLNISIQVLHTVLYTFSMVQTLCCITSVYKFSILFSIHFQWYKPFAA